MAVESNESIFCACGSLWTVKLGDNNEKYFVCPLCGIQKPVPEDTSIFQIRL